MVHRLFQQLRWNVHLHRVLEGLRHLTGDAGDATEDVDRATLDAIFGDERDVLVLDLQGHGNEYGVSGHFDVVGTHLKGHEVDVDVVADHLFQILEFDWGGRVHLGQRFQFVELFAVLAGLIQGCHWRA